MNSPYRIDYDPTKNRVSFELHGTWDDALSEEWTRVYTATVAKARPGFTVLADTSDYPLQTETIQATHEAMMGHSIQHGMSKGVLVVPGAIVEMQLRRLAAASDAQSQYLTFTATVAEAERILDGVTV